MASCLWGSIVNELLIGCFPWKVKYSMYVQDEDKFNTKWKKDREGKIGKVTFYCTEKESRGGKVLKI